MKQSKVRDVVIWRKSSHHHHQRKNRCVLKSVVNHYALHTVQAESTGNAAFDYYSGEREDDRSNSVHMKDVREIMRSSEKQCISYL